MAKGKRRSRENKLTRGQFWTMVILSSVLLAFVSLVTISSYMDKPFMPTWDELFSLTGLSGKQPLDTEMQVHVLDVGNADAILVRNKGQNLLIDAGENDDGADVVAYLRSHGVKKLDYVIATHPDADHIGGMDDVVEAMDIGTFIMAFMPEGYTPTSKTYADMLEAISRKGLKITSAQTGKHYSLGEADIEILGPVADFTETNNQSVVCRISFGDKRFLFMGDAEKEAENALMEARGDLSADVLKIGHHGSKSSTQSKFVKMVSPAYAVISCGENNSYKHPHPETLDTLEELKIRCYRTDRDGTVVITTDGQSITFETEKGE